MPTSRPDVSADFTAEFGTALEAGTETGDEIRNRTGSGTATRSGPGPTAESVSPDSGSAAEILLELVDDQGRTIGTAEKLFAHQEPGRLHRAFSVFLFDAQGRLLLQRRALGKYHSPGVWSNTCCGHPYPGEPPFVAAARRTAEELGAAPALLSEAGTVRYDLPDAASGLIEREWNHLFVGLVNAPVVPDPAEVDAYLFVGPEELRALEAERPFSVWFRTVLNAALPGIQELTGRNW